MNEKRLLELAKQAEKMPDVIEGMTSAEVGAKYHAFMGLLAEELKSKRIVELGSYIGETTKYMAKMAPDAIVIAVDINPDAMRQLEQVEPIFSNIKAFTDDASHFAALYDGEPIDLLFIDSNHDRSHTMANYRAWEPFVKDGGVIAMDDWTLDNEMQLVREDLVQMGKLFIEIPNIHVTGFAIEIKTNEKMH